MIILIGIFFTFFEAAGAVVEIGRSLNIISFNQDKLALVRETHSSTKIKFKPVAATVEAA